MSAESESRRRPVPQLDGEEEEVDLGRYWRAVAARWWLLLVGVVVGAAIGFIVTAGGSRPFEATALVYVGQPFAPGSASPIQNLPTQVAFASELVLSRRERNVVARQIGVARSRLVDVSAEPIQVFKRRGTGQATPLVQITVGKLPARKAVQAADAFAQRLVVFFSRYVNVKLGTYNARLERAARELKRVEASLVFARTQQQRVLATTLDPAEKFLLLANLNNVIVTNEARQATLEAQQLTLRDQIALGREVERPSVTQRATAHRQAAPSKRTGAAVGAFIGVILGLLAALIWDPVERRLRRNRPSA